MIRGMTGIHWRRSNSDLVIVADVLWRCLVVGVGYAGATAIAGLIARGLGLSFPSIATQIDPTTSLMLRGASGFLLGLIVSPLAVRLRVPAVERFAVLALLLLIVNQAVNLIEGFYFTTYFTTGFASTLVTALIGSSVVAWLLAVLFPPRVEDRRLLRSIQSYYRQRSVFAWAWRILLAGALYLPTYFVFGMLAYPFVQAYYQDPSLGAGVRVPGVEVILPLEVVRGLLYVLAVLPLVALLRYPRWGLALLLGLTIAGLNAWEPLIANTLWPATMRLTHGLEITGDALVQGVTIAWLLGWPDSPIRNPGD